MSTTTIIILTCCLVILSSVLNILSMYINQKAQERISDIRK